MDIIYSHSDDCLGGVEGMENTGSENMPKCKAVRAWDGTNAGSDCI